MLLNKKETVLFIKSFEKKTEEFELTFQKKFNNLEELKKSILQKAFAGEITR